MLTLMLSITLISSIMFIMMKHPLSMGMMLLLQTIATTMITSFFNHNTWYSYILFLIMVGGMLILFIYMTSVASNEKFKFSMKTLTMFFILIFSLLTLWYILNNFFINMNNYNLESLSINSNYSISLTKFFNSPMNMILFLMIIYLLITLIAVVKITTLKKGPLRQMN
uniref:NADH dehydrogenase subunit 6 n=1 Tax=Apogonia splendida TaxID=2962664 RepID=UPI002114B057|nr:NADH dehydrogenase subunit 6 [Apogonia splendida]UTE83835.1 NADH dehydrogenase subunit 6 [Apogonia splendida]